MDHMMLYLNLVEHDEIFKLEPKSSVICDTYWEKAKDVLFAKQDVTATLILLAPTKRYMLACSAMDDPNYKQALEEVITTTVRERKVHSVIFASMCMSKAMKDNKPYREGESLIVWAQHLGQEPMARVGFVDKGPDGKVIRIFEDSNISDPDKPFGFVFRAMPVFGKYDEDSLYRGKDKK